MGEKMEIDFEALCDVVKIYVPEIEKKIETEEFYCEEQVYKYLVKHNHLNTFKFLHEHYEIECTSALFYAAKYNKLEFVKCMDALDVEFYEDFVDDVVEYGSLECLVYWHERLYCVLGSDYVAHAEKCKQYRVADWIKNELEKN